MQSLAEAKVQPENDQEKDAKLDGVENDTLSPRFWEVSRFPDYTFHADRGPSRVTLPFPFNDGGLDGRTAFLAEKRE